MSSQFYNLIVEIPRSPARYYQLAAEVITVGRGEQNAVIVDEEAVSSSHCELRRKGKGFVIVDLGSTNGTRINGEPLQGEPRELREGDSILLGLAARARYVRVTEVKEKAEGPATQSGAATQRLKQTPSRPTINPVAAAMAKAAKGKG
ncbi:MAG: FHA domain-containing protein [Verrucomicrobiales bacterium]|nr:FHA domain-containing protein [Verrucomicrobiales bacterium]